MDTVTVASWTGQDREMSHDQFREVWMSHVLELSKLCHSQETYQEYQQIKNQISEMIDNEFNRLREAQS